MAEDDDIGMRSSDRGLKEKYWWQSVRNKRIPLKKGIRCKPQKVDLLLGFSVVVKLFSRILAVIRKYWVSHAVWDERQCLSKIDVSAGRLLRII